MLITNAEVNPNNPTADFVVDQATVTGNSYLCEALEAGRMDLSHFVTQRYPIEQFEEAMTMADKRPEPVLKVMVEF